MEMPYSLLQIFKMSWTMYVILYVIEFWEMDPNHTFIFDYISHYHIKSIMLYKIFLKFYVDFNIKEMLWKCNHII